MGRKRRKTFNFLPKKEKIWKNRCNSWDAMIYWACHAIEYFSVVQACVFPLGKNTCSFRILVWQIMWIAWQHRACIFRARRVRCAAHFLQDQCMEELLLNELFWWILAGGLLVVLWYLLEVYLPYRDRATDIKMEIERSLNVCERRFWQKKLRRLRLKLIPIVRLFVRL